MLRVGRIKHAAPQEFLMEATQGELVEVVGVEPH